MLNVVFKFSMLFVKINMEIDAILLKIKDYFVLRLNSAFPDSVDLGIQIQKKMKIKSRSSRINSFVMIPVCCVF